MSNDKPTINVTRGSRGKKSSTPTTSSSKKQAASSSLPSAMDVAQGLAETTRRMWLAGLGALSMAEEAGTSAFNALVDEGKSWEQARRERTDAVSKQVKRLADESADAASAVEDRVRTEIDNALSRVGVPSRDDIDDLRDQVNDLHEKVDRLANALHDNGEKKTS